jgi:hypothetical protein
MLRRVLDGFDCLHPRRRLGSGDKVAAPCTTATASTTTNGAGSDDGGRAVTIRVATFNAAMFSMAPAVPTATGEPGAAAEPRAVPPGSPAGTRRPKGILKARASQLARSPSKARVCINVQDDEISLERRGRLGGSKKRQTARRRSVEEVLREAGADVVALQNVRAQEERGMRPLSELAEGLGMRYVFAESWAPDYGNAVLSRWPIKRWKAQRVADPSDFRSLPFLALPLTRSVILPATTNESTVPINPVISWHGVWVSALD